MSSPSPRRRFQFSLRTLFVVVTLAAVTCFWAAKHFDRWADKSPNSLRGISESEVLARFGDPDKSLKHHLQAEFGERWPNVYTRELLYEHHNGQTLSVLLAKQLSGDWRCYESAWLPDGE